MKWFGILFYIFSVASLNAQEQHSGRVLNNRTLEPLPNVIVTIVDGNSILSFTQTNPEGAFELSTENIGNFKIIFRKSGYETLEDSINSPNNVYYLIPTQKDPEYLEEVIVNAEKSYLRTKEDTTTYVADELRSSPVTTIEDLISNIPGVSIDEQSGTIRYQNTEISTILIDGDNITDRNYQIVSKNLTQKAAKAIQVIEGYTENTTLKNFERSNKVALNLQVEDVYKNRLNGSVKAGLGIKDRYDSSINLFSFSEKLKTINLAEYNNVGNFSLGNVVSNKEFEDNDRPLLNLNELNSIYLKPNLDRMVIFSLFNSRNILQNNDFTLSTNQIYRFEDESEAKMNAILYTDKLSYFSSQRLIPINKGNPVLTNTLYSSKRLKNVDVKLHFKKMLNANEELVIRGIFKNRNRELDEDGEQNLNNITTSTEIDHPEVQMLVDYSKKINSKSALMLFNNVTLSNLEEDAFLFSNDQIQHPSLTNFTTNAGYQKTGYSSLKNNFGINYAYKFSTNSVLTSALLYSKYNLNSNSFYESIDEDVHVEVFNNNLEQKVNLLSPQLQWAHFGRKGRLTALGKLTYIGSKTDNDNRSHLEFTPSVNYAFKKTTQNFNIFEYSLGFERRLVMYDFFARTPDPIRKSLNSFYINDNEDLYYLTNSFSFSTSYKVRKNGINLNLNSSYGFGEKPLIDNLTFFENYFIQEVLNRENQFKEFSLTGEVERFFPAISTNIEVRPRFSYYKWENLIENVEYDNLSNNYQLRIGAGSAFATFLNYSVGTIFNYTTISQKAHQYESDINIQKTISYLNFNFAFLNRKLILNLENEYVVYDNNSDFFYSSFNARYKPSNSNFDFRLDLRNIFNNSNYFSRSQSLNYIQEYEISVIPRMFLLGVTYYMGNSD